MEEDSLRDFLKKLGDKSPTPGGGSVSALNGAIAAAQLKMVCEYTKDEEINQKTALLAQKASMFLDLAEDDSAAFLKVSEAYKTKDSKAIDSALINATQVSVNITLNCEDLVLFCEVNHHKFNQKLQADVITVLANLRAGVSSAQAMEKTNLDSIKTEKPENLLANVAYSDGILQRIDKMTQKIKA